MTHPTADSLREKLLAYSSIFSL